MTDRDAGIVMTRDQLCIDELERVLRVAEDALREAAASYREVWKHPGTDKVGHLLPAPSWVQNVRAAIEQIKELRNG